ncbi:MAG: hypothetical protein H6732_00825 [Alphaproteobacteria bacterium]|nr:hypothetical protein [Alphaproteobacteria bacterium]
MLSATWLLYVLVPGLVQAGVVLLSLGLLVRAAFAWRGLTIHDVHRQERVRWTPTRHAVLARETIAGFVLLALRPIGWADAPLPRETSGCPVLLVPDPRLGRGALALLEVFLRQRGLAVWPVRLSHQDASLGQLAERLQGEVGRLREATGATQVDLVGFGLGGLVAAWLCHHLDGAATVRRLVTLGTPWRGTRLAVFYPGTLAREIRPDAHDLDGLASCGVDTLSVWCPEDPEVVPAESACADPARSVAVEGAGHLGMLLSARTFRAVLTGLRDALPEPG